MKIMISVHKHSIIKKCKTYQNAKYERKRTAHLKTQCIAKRNEQNRYVEVTNLTIQQNYIV